VYYQRNITYSKATINKEKMPHDLFTTTVTTLGRF
jgi:hypothetical protein